MGVAARVLRSPAPRAPRRVSGPARPRAVPRRPEPVPQTRLARVSTLADARLLERLVRGRFWIPIVAVALLGIVFMQISMLKLNAGIGRAVQASLTLERQNALLRAEVSRLDGGERIQGVASRLGMVLPPAGGHRYLTAGREGEAQRAAASVRPPAPIESSPQVAAVPPAASVTQVATDGTGTGPAVSAGPAAGSGGAATGVTAGGGSPTAAAGGAPYAGASPGTTAPAPTGGAGAPTDGTH